MRFHRFSSVFRYTLGAGRCVFALAVCLLVPLSATGQVNPVPFVNQPLIPAAIAPGGPSFTLTVNGTGFVPASVVNWNGSPRPTTFVSNSQLTAAIPATDIATIGSASVTVFSPAPGGGVSNAGLFLVTFPVSSVTFTRTDLGTTGGVVALATADFNGDEKPDIAVLQDGAVLIFLGNGDGTFQGQRSFPTDGYVGGGGRMVLGDFNGDGKIDVAVANHQSNADPTRGSISVLLGNGDGTLQPAVSTTVPGMLPQEMVSADFNGDGALDVALAATASRDAEVQILLGRGNGSFITGPVYTTSLGNISLLGFAGGDFDRDGQLDLPLSLCYNYSSPSGANYCIYHFWPLLGNGDGSFRWGTNFTGAGGYGITAVDLNADGNLDVAGGYPIDPEYFRAGVYILFGAGDGTFQGAVGLQVGSGSVTGLPVAADMNGDGKLDLITPGHYQFFVLIGNGAGSFQTPGTSYYPAPYPPSVPAVADFNGDGRLDLAMGYSGGSSLSVFMQPSLVDLQPGGFHFGDQLIGTPDNTGAATLTNNAGGPLTISSIAVTGASAADFTETNDCPLSPSTLAAGVSCTITVTFDHTTVGEKTAAVTVSDDAPGYPQQVLNLTGSVVNPTATLSSTSLDFGNQPLDVTSAAQTVTVSNSGVGALTILGITVTGDFAVTNNCGTRLAQGAQCEVSVTFDPTNPGTLFGILTITDNAADSPQIISLSGTGIPPTVTLSTTSLTFGNQKVWTTSPPQTVTLTNNGPGPLSHISTAQTNEFGATSDCGGTVAASASCTISVTFTPEVNGTRTGTATIYDNAVGSPQMVSLTGTGLGPVASPSPSSLNFPDQPVGITSPPQTVTLTNSGAATMTLTGILATSPFGETTDCAATLSAGASCAIVVTFTPNVAGTTYGALILSDDAPGSPQTVSLTGTTAVNFGQQPVGQTSAPQIVSLTNTGSTPRVIAGVATTGDFAQSSACGTLAAGQSCPVNLTFTPAAPGTRTGALVIADNAPGSPHVMNLTGTGLGPGVSLSAASLDLGSQLVGTTGAAQTVTLENSGNEALSLTGISLGGTHSGDFAQTNNCPASLAATASCTLSVTFKPTASGARNGTLTVTDNAPGSPHTVALWGTGTDFSLSSNPTSQTVTAGQSATYALSVSPLGGFNQSVALTCTKQTTRTLATCSVSPSTVTLDGTNAATVTVTVTTRAVGRATPFSGHRPPPQDPPRGRHTGLPLQVWLLALLAATVVAAAFRPPHANVRLKPDTTFPLAGALLLVLLWAACGGGVGGGGNPGTPLGTYTLTVTGTVTTGSGNLSHNLTFTLKVN
ncbi:MAG: choice-of-anchor D domain-containing protein [Terriglobia bacterium]